MGALKFNKTYNVRLFSRVSDFFVEKVVQQLLILFGQFFNLLESFWYCWAHQKFNFLKKKNDFKKMKVAISSQKKRKYTGKIVPHGKFGKTYFWMFQVETTSTSDTAVLRKIVEIV